MSLDQIKKRLNQVDSDPVIQNLIAQANARYILLNTGEDRKNFPPYTIKDDNLNALAFYYLNLGCELAESDDIVSSIPPLEKGASLLEFVHNSESNQYATSSYYGLIGAMAYYVGFQYSKSFIMIKNFESTSTIAMLIHLFIARNFDTLQSKIDEIVVDNRYDEQNLIENEIFADGQRMIFEISIAKSLNNFLQYLTTGDQEFIDEAKNVLSNLKEITELELDPGMWWVVRLLILISTGFEEASLWKALESQYDTDNHQVKNYIRSLVYMPGRRIHELFITQRQCLTKVLNENDGCIVSIPTSSGKTRIAELAILKCLINNPDKKVLYIAPFRSLAFEVENALESSLDAADISVSHLYGGSLFSKLDEKIVDDSDVIIATPEKAKAIFRGNEQLMDDIQLVIVDEGHLLGTSQRMVSNEAFNEELRYFMGKNGGKFLLLSAVLPNADDLAQWLNTSVDTVYRNTWRPSNERLGFLQWTGNHVNLNWVSQDEERSSFNTRFIVRHELPWKKRQRVPKFFPGDKNQAVAMTALRFRAFGPVLIFVGRKPSVFVMAKAYLESLGNDVDDHVWSSTVDWKAFKLASIEIYGHIDENPWLKFASKGILCHNADLHADVRLPLERLMRNDKPSVIIATSTLGQGVNLGVSTVIFSTVQQGIDPVSSRDFWNIAGRAGRAFVDHEGKILVALNTENLTNRQTQWKFNNISEKYFDKDKIRSAQSGILNILSKLKKLALENGINFETLIELVTENRLLEINEGDPSEIIDLDNKLNWIDDTLLSLNLFNSETGNPLDDSMKFHLMKLYSFFKLGLMV